MELVGKLIALVEDDGAVRDSLTFLLRIAGYQTCGYESSEALLRDCDLSRVAGLILDYKLPGLTGLELAIEVRRRGWPVPILLISAGPIASLTKRAEAIGIRKVLEKPSSENEILEFASSLDIALH